MNEENEKERSESPLAENIMSKVVGGNDPFANLPTVINNPIDEAVTENG